MKMEQFSETSEHKIQSRGITQKKEYNIHYTAKVWNQEFCCCYIYNLNPIWIVYIPIFLIVKAVGFLKG